MEVQEQAKDVEYTAKIATQKAETRSRQVESEAKALVCVWEGEGGRAA